jgi:hypothetical protein
MSITFSSDSTARLGQLAARRRASELNAFGHGNDHAPNLQIAAVVRKAASDHVQDLRVLLTDYHVVVEGHCQTYTAMRLVVEAIRALRLRCRLDLHLDVPSYGSDEHREVTERSME